MHEPWSVQPTPGSQPETFDPHQPLDCFGRTLAGIIADQWPDFTNKWIDVLKDFATVQRTVLGANGAQRDLLSGAFQVTRRFLGSADIPGAPASLRSTDLEALYKSIKAEYEKDVPENSLFARHSTLAARAGEWVAAVEASGLSSPDVAGEASGAGGVPSQVKKGKEKEDGPSEASAQTSDTPGKSFSKILEHVGSILCGGKSRYTAIKLVAEHAETIPQYDRHCGEISHHSLLLTQGREKTCQLLAAVHDQTDVLSTLKNWIVDTPGYPSDIQITKATVRDALLSSWRRAAQSSKPKPETELAEWRSGHLT